MTRNKRILSLLTAAAVTAVMPMQAAASPQFAHDEATWARLQDNVMEYDEIQLLVEEYNPQYLNNQTTYQDTKEEKDAAELRRDMLDSADDSLAMADDMRSLAEDLLDTRGAYAAEGYVGYMAAAAAAESGAIKNRQSADKAYEDSEMKRLNHINDQMALVVQVQGIFDSYNQLRKTITATEKQMELQEAVYRSAETKASIGAATQVDVLTQKKALQSLQSNYTNALSSMENTRQKLCVMTGWSYNDRPEIREVPAADMNRILLMNPETDKQTALEKNYKLQYNKRSYNNMTDGTADKKNMERTIKNQEENIKAGVQTLYNDILQKKTELELAEAELATEATKMSSIETKFQLGTASNLEYLQEQVAFAGKQISRNAADMTLFQAMETYDWALQGYMNLG